MSDTTDLEAAREVLRAAGLDPLKFTPPVMRQVLLGWAVEHAMMDIAWADDRQRRVDLAVGTARRLGWRK